jgi:hypothetical protein
MSTSHLRYVGSDPDLHELTIGLEMLSAASQINSPDQATRERAYRDVMRGAKPLLPPFEVLPCANAQPKLRTACDKPGNMACSGCRLVSYCSKVRRLLYEAHCLWLTFDLQDCQKEHWKVHKQGVYTSQSIPSPSDLSFARLQKPSQARGLATLLGAGGSSAYLR